MSPPERTPSVFDKASSARFPRVPRLSRDCHVLDQALPRLPGALGRADSEAMIPVHFVMREHLPSPIDPIEYLGAGRLSLRSNPMTLRQHTQCSWGVRGYFPANDVRAAQFVEKMFREGSNVLFAIAEWRDTQRDDVHSIVEVFSESSF